MAWNFYEHGMNTGCNVCLSWHNVVVMLVWKVLEQLNKEKEAM